MPKKRQMSAEQFAKGFAKIAADYLETVPVEEREARIAALKSKISKSGRGIHSNDSRTARTPVTRLAARSLG
jgi:uncharacterized small protein (DUF1192 family)